MDGLYQPTKINRAENTPALSNLQEVLGQRHQKRHRLKLLSHIQPTRYDRGKQQGKSLRNAKIQPRIPLPAHVWKQAEHNNQHSHTQTQPQKTHTPSEQQTKEAWRTEKIEGPLIMMSVHVMPIILQGHFHFISNAKHTLPKVFQKELFELLQT